MNKIIRIEGLEKKLRLNKVGEVRDLFFPVLISNMVERYKHKESVLKSIYDKNITSYARISGIDVQGAKYNINLVREVQGLDEIK